MPVEAPAEETPAWPRDGGPRYIETPEFDPGPQLIIEPWNGASAALFVAVAVFWIVRLRGRYRQFPFLCISLPILLVGGVGGTLYHATRSSRVWFLMDVIPINLLGAVVSVFLWFQLGPKLRYLIGMVGILGLIQVLGQLNLPRQWAINLSYASLALIVLVPLVLVLIKTRFRFGGWVATAFACFAIAWFFRIADATIHPPLLPMGSHWLWHVFGACCTLSLSYYFFLLEREKAERKALTANAA